ncbi:MAG TPA: hypothetical protein VFJ58_14565 [Armatimonadota bacterium]|nr:hypothetical protein [Armatimonadota bacterium]
MKLRSAALAVSTSLLAAGLAFVPAAHAQMESTIVVIGGAPDVVYMDSTGRMHELNEPTEGMNGAMTTSMNGGMTGTMNNGQMNTVTAQTPMGPMAVNGVEGDWEPGFNVPVFSGVVTSNDPVLERAVVRSNYGYVAVPTGAGAKVLYNDKAKDWLTVPLGAVVELPLTDLVSGPVPHRVYVNYQRIMSPGMGMGMGMMNVGPAMPAGGSMGGMNMNGMNMNGTAPAAPATNGQ